MEPLKVVQNPLGVRFSDIATDPRIMMMPIEGYEKMPLVSLEEAIEPLVGLVRDIQRRTWIAKQTCQNPADNLTPDESAAILLYTAEWVPFSDSLYIILNSTLRTKGRTKLRPWFLYLKLLLTALSHLPSIGNRTVYRGVREDISSLYSPGKTCIWWGFSSCTVNINVLETETFLGKTGSRTLFVIECFSGKDVHQHAYVESENEVLLLPATQFEIIANLNPSPDFHIIQLKEIKPLHKLLEPISSDQITVETKSSKEPNKKANASKSMPYIFTRLLSRGLETHQGVKLEKKIARFEPSSLIDLDRQSLTDQDIPTVIEQAVAEKQCTMLRLSYNKITATGASILAEGLQNNTSLEGLYLFNNHVSDAGAYHLAQVLATNKSNLKALSLGWNGITDDGVKFLTEILKKNNTLIELWLPRNKISDKGVQMLSDVLVHHDRSLQRLSLDLNKSITDSSVDFLISMIKESRALGTLCVRDCNLSKAGKTRLIEAAESKKDFELKL